MQGMIDANSAVIQVRNLPLAMCAVCRCRLT
jgi:hypothetical protein